MSNAMNTRDLIDALAFEIALHEDNGMPVPVALYRAWEDAVEALG